MISHTVQMPGFFFCAFNIGPAAAVPAVPVPPPLGLMVVAGQC